MHTYVVHWQFPKQVAHIKGCEAFAEYMAYMVFIDNRDNGWYHCAELKEVNHDKRKTICILAAASILKLLLPERQINKKIYKSFDNLLYHFNTDEWIKLYILWELSLIKELGYEFDNLDEKISSIINKNSKISNDHVKKALSFNKGLLMENLIIPNKLRFPLSRNILEKYFA